jgi:membrane protein
MAALLAHYGFLSVFPLLICFTTILGWVLEGNRDLQASIVDSALGNFPVIGQQLQADPGALNGSGLVFAAAFLTAVWASLKAFVVAQSAIDDIEEIPLDARTGLVGGRLRALATIAVVGLAQVLTAVSAALMSATGIAGIAQVALLVPPAIVNIVLVAVAYQLLSTRKHSWRAIRPGSVLTGLLYVALQLVGSLVVGRAVTQATPVYGTFATVIGLLTWLAVHAVVALVGYQLNMVLVERRAQTSSTPRTMDTPLWVGSPSAGSSDTSTTGKAPGSTPAGTT